MGAAMALALQALHEWAGLAHRVGRRNLMAQPFCAAAAAEEGMALFQRQLEYFLDPLQLQGDADEDELQPLSVDDIAAAARQAHPGMFAAELADVGTPLLSLAALQVSPAPSPDRLADRLHALSAVSQEFGGLWMQTRACWGRSATTRQRATNAFWCR